MTLRAWLGFIICDLIAWALVLFIAFEASRKGALSRKITVAVMTVLSLIVLGIMLWYYQSTAQGSRALKTQRSNFSHGIEREVEVYSMDGKLIKTYKGKFDLEYDDDRILFDDENGDRHIIYYQTGTVFIDEVSDQGGEK